MASLVVTQVLFVPGGLAASSQSRLLDRFYFCSPQQGLGTSGGGTISATSGSLVERVSPDTYNLLGGTITITSGLRPLTINADTLKMLVPVNSSLSIRLSPDSVMTLHRGSRPVTLSGIANGVSFTNTLNPDTTVPAGATAIPAGTGDKKQTPLMFVGDASFLPGVSGGDNISLSSGNIFFSTPRALRVMTPLGVIDANANSRFFVALPQDSGSVRVLNCSSKTIKFESGKKFRRITSCQEFCLFDHRPTQEEVLPADGLGRKEVVLHEVEGQTTASINSFLIVTMLASPNFLGDWRRDSATDKKLLSVMLKSAAALESASPSSEQFYVAPNLYKDMR